MTPYRGRTVLAGWVSGFAEGRGWRGCMSLPRVLSLKGGSLIQTPLPELSRLRRRHTRVERLALEDGVRVIPEARGKALEIVAELAPRDAARCGLRVRCRNDGSGGLAISYAAGTNGGAVGVNGGAVGVLDVAGTRLPLRRQAGETLRLHLFLDHSVMELFVQDGAAAVTRVDYAPEDDLALAVFAESGSATVVSLEAWEMASIWQGEGAGGATAAAAGCRARGG